ncbi:MAG: glutathione S-transferase family protein, partial [Microvirga sp.]
MTTLHHYAFCPHSRFIRLVLAEMGLHSDVQEEKPWERRVPFLALNPAGTIPVFVEENGMVVPGASVIAEYLDETHGSSLGDRRLLPPDVAQRIEVRRLLEWFLVKFYEEVTGYL